MVRMRKHIKRLDFLDIIMFCKSDEVSCLSRRIAADVYDPIGIGPDHYFHHIRMHTRSGRISYYNIGRSIFHKKIFIECFPDIANYKRAIINVIRFCIFFGVINGFLNFFYPNDFKRTFAI